MNYIIFKAFILWLIVARGAYAVKYAEPFRWKVEHAYYFGCSVGITMAALERVL